MQTIENNLIKFYDAVLANDAMEVQRILKDNVFSEAKFTIKMITGMLVMAVESGFSQAGQAILAHNSFAEDKISYEHLKAIMRLADKNNSLTPLRITIN